MNIEFTHGATVHEMWGTLIDGTLIGAFQYERDAKLFASQRLADDASHDQRDRSYLVVDHYKGATTLYRHRPKEGSTP